MGKNGPKEITLLTPQASAAFEIQRGKFEIDIGLRNPTYCTQVQYPERISEVPVLSFVFPSLPREFSYTAEFIYYATHTIAEFSYATVSKLSRFPQLFFYKWRVIRTRLLGFCLIVESLIQSTKSCHSLSTISRVYLRLSGVMEPYEGVLSCVQAI